jgi:hypothetical protein
MERRNALKVFAGAVVGGGAGIFALPKVFRPDYLPMEEPRKLPREENNTAWDYHPLNPELSAELAYNYYPEGSCMYAIFKSIVEQLAGHFGEPFTSFPYHMMGYGRSGIGGYGTICGTLNGAAAIIGLLVPGRTSQDNLITGLFRWYERTKLPQFRPKEPILDFTPSPAVSHSTICHASVTTWGKDTGYKADSGERVERCRRLTGDVAAHVTFMLNEYFADSYITSGHDNQTVRECMTCHGNKGKLNNTVGKMDCNSCHTESVMHKIFANPHYNLKKAKPL